MWIVPSTLGFRVPPQVFGPSIPTPVPPSKRRYDWSPRGYCLLRNHCPRILKVTGAAWIVTDLPLCEASIGTGEREPTQKGHLQVTSETCSPLVEKIRSERNYAHLSRLSSAHSAETQCLLSLLWPQAAQYERQVAAMLTTTKDPYVYTSAQTIFDRKVRQVAEAKPLRCFACPPARTLDATPTLWSFH